MEKSAADALRDIEKLDQERELSIIKLSEPILAPHESNDLEKRASDASTTSNPDEASTPASLRAELTHYQELFTKLRFSYVEQVTKEKFLRAVVGEPPLYVTPAENAELETQLAGLKNSLKQQKLQVADIVADLERRGRELSRRYNNIQLQKAKLRTMPAEIANMKQSISILRASQGASASDNPDLALSLPKTQDLLQRREAELENLQQELHMLESKVTKKTMEVQRLQDELKPLEAQNSSVTASAREAKRRKEQGLSQGGTNPLEDKGRWLQAVESTMRFLLESEA